MPRFGGPGRGPGGFGGDPRGGFGGGPGGFGGDPRGGYGWGHRPPRPYRRWHGGPGCLFYVLMPVLIAVGLLALLFFL